MLEVINRCINRWAPGSPARWAGWQHGPGHLGQTREGGRRETRSRPTSHLPHRPHPAVCEASAGAQELIHIVLVYSARSLQTAVPCCPTFVPFKSCQKQASRGDPPSLSPIPRPMPGNLSPCSGGFITPITPGGLGM